MPSTVIAHFDTEADAERTLSVLAKKVPLRDSAVLASDVAGRLTLESLDLGTDARAACEAQLKRDCVLLIAQVGDEQEAEAVVRVVDEVAPQILTAAFHAQGEDAAPANPQAPAPETIAEERIPIVEEEVRIGKGEVRRGTAQIRTFPVETPVREEVVLREERTTLSRRPVHQRLTEEEVVRGGLLKERVIEITAMREVPVISKEAVIGEELVVTRHVEQRTHTIDETVRHTEVETERLEPEEGRTR